MFFFFRKFVQSRQSLTWEKLHPYVSNQYSTTHGQVGRENRESETITGGETNERQTEKWWTGGGKRGTVKYNGSI